ELLKRRERSAVPNQQHGWTRVIRIAEEVLAAELEMSPVVAPAAPQSLKVDELPPVPFEDARVPRVACHRAVEGHPLCQRKEVAGADREMVPLLGSKGWESLVHHPL